MEKISIRNFNFYKNNNILIKNLNLSIKENEVFTVFGPDFLSLGIILYAINRSFDSVSDVSFDGEILLNGENIYDPNLSVSELRRKVSLITAVPHTLPMSIFDNVAFGMRSATKRNNDAVIAEVVEQTLTQADLWKETKDKLFEDAATTLTFGEQQRLSLARVLAMKPEIILLERPCMGLNLIEAAKLSVAILKLKHDHTFFHATDDVLQAKSISDRAAFILDGELIELGDVEEVLFNTTNPQTRAFIDAMY